MPNYEHFKKYDEWSKQKPSQPAAEPQQKQTLLSKLLKPLKDGKK